ncbi:Beta-fructofuranosidase [Trichinella spiralis]|uniref:Beta-fructofuranosidase n=1 Tax=Trichinella spiralis TaxID=6334 RepID=A0ABR3KFX5_TRISP
MIYDGCRLDEFNDLIYAKVSWKVVKIWQFHTNFRFRYLIVMNKALLLLRLGVLNMNDYNRLLEKVYHHSVQKDGNNVEESLSGLCSF